MLVRDSAYAVMLRAISRIGKAFACAGIHFAYARDSILVRDFARSCLVHSVRGGSRTQLGYAGHVIINHSMVRSLIVFPSRNISIPNLVGFTSLLAPR
jgi:hypothetical protein